MDILLTRPLPEVILKKYDANFIIPKVDFTNKDIMEISNIDAIIAVGSKIDEAFINSARGLKITGTIGVGYDNIDFEYAKSRGIAVINTPNTVTYATAEVAIGLMINVARKISLIESELKKEKAFNNNITMNQCFTLKNKTLGIVGFGRIGKQVAKIANAFGMNVVYTNNRKAPISDETAHNSKYIDFDELIKISDFISVNCPYTKEAHHMFSHEQFKKMKDTAFFINTGRGKLQNEEALINALKSKEIAGCGLDVFEFEPEISKELFDMNNVVLTPHIGTFSEEVRFEMYHECLSSCIDFLNGKPVHNLI